MIKTILILSMSLALPAFGRWKETGGGDPNALEFISIGQKILDVLKKNPSIVTDVSAATFSQKLSDLEESLNNVNEKAKIIFTDAPVIDPNDVSKFAVFDLSNETITVNRDNWKSSLIRERYELASIELLGLCGSPTRYSDALKLGAALFAPSPDPASPNLVPAQPIQPGDARYLIIANAIRQIMKSAFEEESSFWSGSLAVPGLTALPVEGFGKSEQQGDYLVQTLEINSVDPKSYMDINSNFSIEPAADGEHFNLLNFGSFSIIGRQRPDFIGLPFQKLEGREISGQRVASLSIELQNIGAGAGVGQVASGAGQGPLTLNVDLQNGMSLSSLFNLMGKLVNQGGWQPYDSFVRLYSCGNLHQSTAGQVLEINDNLVPSDSELTDGLNLQKAKDGQVWFLNYSAQLQLLPNNNFQIISIAVSDPDQASGIRADNASVEGCVQ